MPKVPNEIIVLAVRAISGEVTPNMRAIGFGYNGTDAAKFRFYMSDEPNEEEIEIGEIVAVNFEAGHPSELKELEVEFVTTDQPLGKLDVLDFGLYRRWEDPDAH